MDRKSAFNFYKNSIALIGFACLVLALLNLEAEVLTLKFAAFYLLVIFVAPWMSVSLPRSKFTLKFSDSLIFLSFLLFGGEAAIITAITATIATNFYNQSRNEKLTSSEIAFNIGAISITTSFTYCIWILFSRAAAINPTSAVTTHLLVTLGVLAISRFLASTVLASIYFALKNNLEVFEIWKEECFSISVAHFAGTGLAGIIYKIVKYGDVFSMLVSIAAFAVVYYNYRLIINSMLASIEQAEQAEREKAEAEREKRREIEKYAAQMSLSLKKEEENGRQLRKSRRQFQRAALHDSLTKLPNRAYFIEILKEMIAESQNGSAQDSYVLYLDLTRFKSINDSLGHLIGDKVLMIIAGRFSRLIRSQDSLARIAGDEFAIVLRNLSSPEKAEKVAWKIHQAVSKPFTLSKNKIHAGVDIGIAPFRAGYQTPEEVLRDADIAMNFAKESGSGVAFFTPELREKFVEHATLEAELPFAVERGELSMHYQPLVSLDDGSLIGFEALLRWHHHKLGFISPARFIPIAENTSVIIPITNWILGETCRQIKKWQKSSAANKNLIVSVNISGKHLSHSELIGEVEKALEQSQLAPSSLKLEITESAAMENAEQTIRMLSHLKSLGVQLSIDDFGTGYSSLSYLHRLPFDTLKIDRSFVNSVGAKGEDSEILQTIISLAKNLKMRVIAEGIETESQLAVLQNLGCDYGQGYLMAKPQPVEAMDILLGEKHFWLPVSPEKKIATAKSNFAKEEKAVAY